jgi:hypothetical protein
MSRVGKYKREMERVKGVGNGKQKDWGNRKKKYLLYSKWI